MKYLFVHDHILRHSNDDYYSSGGLSNNVMHRYLYCENDTITLYTRQIELGKENKKKLIKVNDEVVFCEPSKIYNGPKDYFKKRKIIKSEIRDLVKKSNFVIMRIPSFLGYFTFEEVKRQNKKYLFEMVACPWDSLWNHSSMLGKILAPIMYLKTKIVCKNAKNIIYVSNEFLQKRYPTKGNNIACSNVNLEMVDNNVLKKRLSKIEKFDGKKIKIGLIGSLNVNFKGHIEAIKMAKILKSNGYNIEVHFLGAGNKEKWVDLAKKENVEQIISFDGTLPSGEPVLKWIDDLDIYIIPSLQEGLPRALIEAMSRACPAIGMKTGGIPELIDKRFVCKRKDYKDLANKIIDFINNKDLMIEAANDNFNSSKEYLKNRLDERRKKFIIEITKK